MHHFATYCRNLQSEIMHSGLQNTNPFIGFLQFLFVRTLLFLWSMWWFWQFLSKFFFLYSLFSFVLKLNFGDHLLLPQTMYVYMWSYHTWKTPCCKFYEILVTILFLLKLNNQTLHNGKYSTFHSIPIYSTYTDDVHWKLEAIFYNYNV